MSEKSYKTGNNIQLINGGKPYFDVLLQNIRSAERQIILQTYIFIDDETGNEVIDALIEARKKDVEILLLVDAFGSKDLSKNAINRLREASVQFRFFAPFFKGKNLSFGRRLHHKIVVFDAQKALVGGINIENKYNDINGKKAWLDFALLIEGTIVKDIVKRCAQINNRRLSVRKKNEIHDKNAVQAIGVKAKVLVNDYLSGKREIAAFYREIIGKAEKEIIIAGSYFMPSKALRRKLRKAAARGVQIKIILTRHSDVGVAQWASKFLYPWMLKHHFLIYEWTASILHAKVAVIDERWSTVGSHNLNFLSDYESIEMNVAIDDSGFSENFSSELKTIIAENCFPVDLTTFEKNNNWLKEVLSFACYYFLRYSWRLAYIISRKR